MPSRRQLTAFAALSAFLGSMTLLSACDAINTDDLSGVWVGSASFTADSILADQNLRIQADYEATFTFYVTDDGGLISGRIEAALDGSRTTTEAGHSPRRIMFNPDTPQVNDMFGTFIDPVLEMDVPDGPYEENLWTFEIGGNGADLNRFITHQHTIMLADSTEFTFEIDSDEFFEMRYVESL